MSCYRDASDKIWPASVKLQLILLHRQQGSTISDKIAILGYPLGTQCIILRRQNLGNPSLKNDSILQIVSKKKSENGYHKIATAGFGSNILEVLVFFHDV